MIVPLRIARPRLLAFFALEGCLIFGVLYGLALLTQVVSPELGRGEVEGTVAAITGFFLAILIVIQTATLGVQASLVREIVLFSVVAFFTSLVCFVGLWVLLPGLQRLSTLLLLEGAIAVPITVALWRWISVRFAVLNTTRETLLIVGTGEIAQQVCRWICGQHAYEYAVLGFADEDDSRLGSALAMGVRIQTDFASLARFGAHRVDRIIVALDEKRGKLPVRQLMELRLLGIEVEDATSFFERVSGKISVETMLPSWLIFSEGFKTSPLRLFLKRTNDLAHAIALLVVTLPVMILTAILIKLDSPGPVFYRQTRMGRNGQKFSVLKFRSMRQDAEKGSGPTWATENDPRVTRVGRVIRFLRIDELPQLINVLRGEMSFVGPRPERAHFVRQLEKRIPYYGLRLVARPGITGWAQVQYRYASTDEDALEKLKYDLYYIKNSGLLFDLWIVLKTIKVVLLGSGAR